MVIDIHVHADDPQRTAPYPGTGMITPERVIAEYDKRGIDKGILQPIINPEFGQFPQLTEDMLKICTKYENRFYTFCNIDPRCMKNTPDARLEMQLAFYKEVGCRGVGEICSAIPIDDSRVENLFACCEEIGLPVLFHIAPALYGYYGLYDDPGLPRLETALAKFPNLIFFGHSQSFWSEITPTANPLQRAQYPSGRIRREGRIIEFFRRYPNLYGDLSGLSGYNAITRDPDFGRIFLEEFSSRLCYGTDFIAPEPNPNNNLLEYLLGLTDRKMLSKEAFENITFRNAARVLNIEV